MVSARTIVTFGVSEDDVDSEPWGLAVTSREMLQVERRVKGFATAEFLQSVGFEGLYRVAWVVLGMRGRIPADLKYDAFIDAWSVTLEDPDKSKRRQAMANRMVAEGKTAAEIMAAVAVGMDEAEPEDPTQPTA